MRVGLLISVAAAAMAAACPAHAQENARRYDIEAQDLASALRAFADTSGREVVAASELVTGRRSTRVADVSSPDAAIAALLAGTGLRAELVEGAYVIRQAAPGDNPPVETAIVVTGTRIRGTAPVGAPVTVIDRSAIARSGRGTIPSLLETIPANFSGGANEAVAGTTSRNGAGLNLNVGSSVNLRGLGSESTLVLFDGNRPALAASGGTFADISLLPQIAIDRIEILTDGASALYGSDAVAGVVNFRFRNRIDGAEMSLRTATADGDLAEYELGGIVGRRWRTGAIAIAYQYTGRSALAGADRAFSTEDLRPWGGPDNRSLFAAPGTIQTLTGGVYAIPAGQDGTALTAVQLLPGQMNRRDARREMDLLPEQRSHAVYASADQELGLGLTAYARLLWARRDFTFRRPGIPASPVLVPSSNAFFVDPDGSGLPLIVSYDFERDFGRQYQTGSTSGVSLSGGVTGNFGPWRIDVSGSVGAQRERQSLHNIVNQIRLNASLADSNRATAYNLFGDGGDTNPATIARLRGSYERKGSFDVWTGSVRADGPLFALPAGNARLAIGYEHRREALDGSNRIDFVTDGPIDAPIPGLPGRRKVEAVYGELLVPLASEGAQWLPGVLDLSVAVRSEWYDTLGQTSNPKLGLRWRPVHPLTLRGTWGTSFRAPGFRDLVGASDNLFATLALPDPQAPGGTSVALALFGYVPDLGPERATTWTAGADIRDWPLRGLTLTATYFDVRYRDRIGTVEADYANLLVRRDLYSGLVTEHPSLAQVQTLFADPGFQNLLGVAASDVTVIVDARTRNLSAVTVRGLDFDLGLERPLGGGTASLGVGGTRLFAIDRKVTATAPRANVVSVLGNPVRWRLRGRAGWSRDGFDLSAFVNHTSGYSNHIVSPAQTVAPWTTVDVQIAYRFGDASPLRNAQIALSAINLFDRDPPSVADIGVDSTLAYDPEQANPVGRTLALQLTLAL